MVILHTNYLNVVLVFIQARGKVFQKMVYDVIWLDNDWGLKEGTKYSILPLRVIRTYVFVVFSSWMVKTVIHHWLWPLATLRSSSTEKWPQSWLPGHSFFEKWPFLLWLFGVHHASQTGRALIQVSWPQVPSYMYIYIDIQTFISN